MKRHNFPATGFAKDWSEAPSSATRASGSTVVDIMRNYGGFESDPEAADRGGISPSVGRRLPRHPAGSLKPSALPSFESRGRATSLPDDLDTLGPGDNPLAPPAERGEADPSGTVTRRRTNLELAATVYLQERKTARDDVADASSRAENLGESNRLFHDLHQASPATAERLARGLTNMPGPGDEFLGFRIVEELGRGAFGRVFLALQGELADRLVALKVSAELPGESQTLAQLQHTNIVPIFSAHHAPPFHAVCMPYFGRATFADLLEDVERQESLPDSGKAFLKAVGSRRSSLRSGSARASTPAPRSSDWRGGVAPDPAPVPIAPESAPAPALELQAELLSETMRAIGDYSYVDAVLWMGSRIADGLAHAHSRGILHRDLKPANILMTDDGQPMILDFNLSEDMKNEVGASAASVGGTLRYMSPEHLERFLGGEIEVDARSDLFALGVILFELLTGHPPFEVYPGHSLRVLRQMVQDRLAGPPAVRRHNPAITPAVESIVRHCLEPAPGRRYRSAGDLHEDLERHLANLPLKYAPEPALAERAGKWVKRHPRLGSSTTVALLAALLLAGLTSALVARGSRLAGFEASRELARFRDEATSVRFALNDRVGDPRRRAAGEALARKALGRYGVLDDPRWLQRPAIARLLPEERLKFREEVAEVLLLLTQAEAGDAAARGEGEERRKLARSAQKLNQIAMAVFPDGRQPQALWAQQAAVVRLLGREDEGARLAAEAEKLPLRTARDHYLAAAALAARGEHAKALPLAEEATRLDPQQFWSYFVLGVCHDHLEHHADAMACFTTCTALRPDFADSWLYRGLAYLKRSNLDLDRARADFDRAAKLRPDWYEPYLHRALVYRELGDHLKAENDLARCLDLGAPETRVYFLRAAERRALGDKRGAELDQAEGLKREPADLPSWISRGMARMRTDPAGALADFGSALKLDPKSLQALQMSAYILADQPGRDEETIRVLDRAVEFHPGFVPFRSGRGVQLAVLGRREEAHRDAQESLWRDTSPSILYQVAGIYATTSKTHPEDRIEAYRLLASALRAGFGFDLIDEDRELDPIRAQPEFQALVDSARGQAKERLRRPAGR